MSQQKNSAVIYKEEGQSFWQPKHTQGYITIKVSPWNVPSAKNTLFFQEIPPGGVIRTHYHETDDEIFICSAGEGVMTLDGVEHPFLPETVIYVGHGVVHSLCAVGDQPLKMIVSVSSTGLEERLKQMGKPRISGELPPGPFESGALSESHGVRRDGE